MMIQVWHFNDAPQKYRDLSINGGDEDWVAVVPHDYPRYIPWLDPDSFHNNFGVCCIDTYNHQDGIVYIGSHS